MNKNIIFIVIAIVVCAGGYFGYTEMQKEAATTEIMSTLNNTYGYTKPDYNISIAINALSNTATATISANKSPSATQTWDISLEKQKPVDG